MRQIVSRVIIKYFALFLRELFLKLVMCTVNILKLRTLFSFCSQMLVFMTVIYEMLVRIANREDPDQTASSEAVLSGSALFV